MYWEEESAFSSEDSSNVEMFACNAGKVLIYSVYIIINFHVSKDKDKRICRHSFGVLFGCWPCGIGIINRFF